MSDLCPTCEGRGTVDTSIHARHVTIHQAKVCPDCRPVVIESDADDVLATRMPQACQTCKGSGVSTEPTTAQHLTLGSCPDCPTIGTLLLYGWNVATAELPGPKAERHMERDELWSLYGQRELLAALREVPQ